MSRAFTLGDVSPRKYFALMTVALGILFALLSPESTTDRGFATALAQWVAQVGLPMLIAILAHIAIHRFSRCDRWNPWLKLLLSGSIAALLFSPFAYVLDVLLGSGTKEGGIFQEWLQEVRSVYPPVVFAWLVINLPFNLGYRIQRKQGPEQAAREAHEAARSEHRDAPFFMTLVPPQLRGELVSLKSELHYLSVATTAGHSLILYNLRDAVQELPANTGCQTHRSHWASLKQVDALERRGRSAILRMKDGSEIPVSRNRVRDVEAAVRRSTQQYASLQSGWQ